MVFANKRNPTFPFCKTAENQETQDTLEGSRVLLGMGSYLMAACLLAAAGRAAGRGGDPPGGPDGGRRGEGEGTEAPTPGLRIG